MMKVTSPCAPLRISLFSRICVYRSDKYMFSTNFCVPFSTSVSLPTCCRPPFFAWPPPRWRVCVAASAQYDACVGWVGNGVVGW